ncbi:MAG: hypothetical protein ISS49_16885 [Anaerolineae bacterium]|nr:hypothetical protein [Anaerolineae bacterium]
MSEEQVREIRAPYVTTTVDTAVEEHTLEQFQVQFPPYFDRFLDERDRRVASELERLEAAVEHNGAKITHMRLEMDRRFAEAKEERETLRLEMDRRFAGAGAGADQCFTEEEDGWKALRLERRAQFHWIIGLELLALVEMVILIIRVFFWETF